MHWSDKYLGRPYRIGDADCAALAVDVIETEFGGVLPDFVHEDRENTRLKRAEQLAQRSRDLIRSTDDPAEGDLVIMLCRARPSHVGIYCVIDGEPAVLHAMENAGQVVRHKIRDLPKYFLALEGYYKWN